MQQLLLSTTGTQSTVIIDDLGGIVFVHPTANFNLLAEFDYESLRDSQDLQNAIDQNWVTVFDDTNNPVPNVLSALDSGKLEFDKNRDNLVDDSERLNNQLASYYTDSLNVNYNNVTSGLTASNIQSAIDELDGNIGNIPHINTTDDLSEGIINFYYTETKFDISFTGKTTSDLTEGINLYYTDTRVSANIDVTTNTLKISADGSIDTHSDVDTTSTPPNTGQFLSWNGANWIPTSSNVATSFLDLSDTPISYTGQAGSALVVTATENGVEFQSIAGLGDMTKAVYDPNLIQLDTFDYTNFINTPTIPNDAIDINYDNGTSGLAANNVQDAIDEQQLTKIDVVNNSTAGNAVLLTSDGQLVDAGFPLGPQDTNKLHVGKTTVQTINAVAETTINWDTPDIQNSAYSFDSLTGVLTINELGWYNLTFNTSHISAAGTTRTSSKAWLELNAGAGYIVLPYTEIIFYARQAGYGSGGAISKLIQLGTGDLIRAQAQLTTTGGSDIAANSTALTIFKSETGINIYSGDNTGPIDAINVTFDKNDTRYTSNNAQDAFVELDKSLVPQIAQEFDAILRDQLLAENGDLARTDKICPAGIANNTNIVSLENNNVIFLNDDVLNPIARLNKGEVFNFTADQGDKISSSLGSYVVSTTYGTMVWNTLAFAGKYFFTEVIRNSAPFRMYVSNFGALATVEVFNNMVPISTTIIQPNDTVEINATGIGEYFIRSNELIDIFAIGDNNSTDSRPLPPVTSELLWWNSSTAVAPNTAKIAVMYPDTIIEYFFADGTTGTATVQPGTSYALPNSVANYNPNGACYVRSAGVIGATNAADTDGSNGTAWISPNFATYRFALPEGSQHVSFVSRYKGVVNMFLPGNTTDIPDIIFNLIQTGTAIENGLFPYSTKDFTARVAGTIYESDVPCNAVFDESTGDETLLIGGLPLREKIISVNDKIGQVQLDAINIPYDNTISGLSVGEVQSAIDLLDSTINNIPIINSTDDVAEGVTNLYYTDARVLTKINNTSIDELLDVDTTTVLPNVGDRFEWDGSNWIPSSISDRILDIYQDTVITSMSTIGQIVTIRWDGINQVGSHYTFNSLDTNIIINTTGWYNITYNLTFEMTSGNKKSNSLGAIYVNNTLMNGSLSAGYHNGSANDENSLGSTKKLNLIVGDIITIRAALISGSVTLSSYNFGNTLTIIKI